MLGENNCVLGDLVSRRTFTSSALRKDKVLTLNFVYLLLILLTYLLSQESDIVGH